MAGKTSGTAVAGVIIGGIALGAVVALGVCVAIPATRTKIGEFLTK